MHPYVFIATALLQVYSFVDGFSVSILWSTIGAGGVVVVMVVISLIPLFTKSPTLVYSENYTEGTVDQVFRRNVSLRSKDVANK